MSKPLPSCTSRISTGNCASIFSMIGRQRCASGRPSKASVRYVSISSRRCASAPVLIGVSCLSTMRMRTKPCASGRKSVAISARSSSTSEATMLAPANAAAKSGARLAGTTCMSIATMSGPGCGTSAMARPSTSPGWFERVGAGREFPGVGDEFVVPLETQTAFAKIGREMPRLRTRRRDAALLTECDQRRGGGARGIRIGGEAEAQKSRRRRNRRERPRMQFREHLRAQRMRRQRERIVCLRHWSRKCCRHCRRQSRRSNP